MTGYIVRCRKILTMRFILSPYRVLKSSYTCSRSFMGVRLYTAIPYQERRTTTKTNLRLLCAGCPIMKGWNIPTWKRCSNLTQTKLLSLFYRHLNARLFGVGVEGFMVSVVAKHISYTYRHVYLMFKPKGLTTDDGNSSLNFFIVAHT